MDLLVPSNMTVSESFHDVGSITDLFPVERLAIDRAVSKRQAEFITGRRCARTALSGLGIKPIAIPRGASGMPIWPESVVGSITHCPGYRAAVAASAYDFMSVGIDAELNAPMPPGVLEAVATPDEQVWIRRRPTGEPDVAWDRLVFSAKEALYKAWYPIARQSVQFSDVTITVSRSDPVRGKFFVEWRRRPTTDVFPVQSLRCEWLVRGHFLHTIAFVPRVADPRRGAGLPCRRLTDESEGLET